MDATSPAATIGSISASFSAIPPKLMVTSCGSSVLCSSSSTSWVSWVALHPCFGSATTDRVRTPFLLTIVP